MNKSMIVGAVLGAVGVTAGGAVATYSLVSGPQYAEVLAVQPTAPRLPVELRTPAPTNYDQRIEYSLESYYKSLGTRSRLLKSETGSLTNTSPTASGNDRTIK